jgi:2-hydroxy-6-oxonona-2,4-dienedioate hydrolase
MPADSAKADLLRSGWTLVRGLRLHSRQSAAPPAVAHPLPVILIPGLIVSSRNMVPTARLLAAAGFWVMALDLPGFGKSDRPPRMFDIPVLADMLTEWLDAANIPRADFLANSFGCQVLADFASRYPERVHRVVMTGPAMDAKARNFVRPILRLLADIFAEPVIVPSALYDLFEIGLRDALQTYLLALRDRIEDKLPRVQAPALVIRGENDPIAPQAWTERVASLIPGDVPLRVVPGAGHALNYSSPKKLVDLVIPFLSQEALAVAPASRAG